MMDIFSAHFGSLQSAILSHQYHEDVGKACRCGAETAPFRCEECFNPQMLCCSCIVSAHAQSPFHHISEWQDTHFNRTSLFKLGASICLGHLGDDCRHRLPGLGRTMVIVHTNGIHRVRVQYCRCELVSEASDAMQLVQAKLFPATMERPETAFTFAVLDDFHLQSLTSKKPVQDYVDALRKHTEPAFPQAVPVRVYSLFGAWALIGSSQNRYKEFTYVQRVWRYLANQRRAGQAHGIDAILTQRRPGSLTVRCPSCPEIGFNIDKKTIDEAKESEMYVTYVYRYDSS
jgi:hypothetical protein